MDRQAYLAQIDAVIAAGPYGDDWDSMAGRQAPSWLRDGKLGIFIHWGVYSVPAFRGEWYSRNMYIQGTKEYEHHIKTFGPHKEFGYKDFIPMLTGAKFDAAEWAELFARAGAKYCVPVAEHHDGFQMYKSGLSKWNAFEMGPKRDVLGELTGALAERGIVGGASSHRIEHWFFMGHGREFDSDIKEPMELGDFYWPAMPEADHRDVFSRPEPTAEFLEDWLLRCCEIVDNYRPKMIYFDWWIQHNTAKPWLRRFAAYYYNRAAQWGDEVAIAYKSDCFPFGTALVDIERGKFPDIQPFFWQTDTAVARNSWGWTENNVFKSAKELICDLVDIVSKNGAMLLNIGPKPDGTISEQDRAVLLGIGDWLRVNGEAIYGTRTWRIAGEGPTKTREGQFTDAEETVFTPEDIRFTSRGSSLYATVLSWPEDGNVLIKSLARLGESQHPVFQGIINGVSVLGGGVTWWTRDECGLTVRATGVRSDLPVVIKITVG